MPKLSRLTLLFQFGIFILVAIFEKRSMIGFEQTGPGVLSIFTIFICSILSWRQIWKIPKIERKAWYMGAQIMDILFVIFFFAWFFTDFFYLG